MHEVDDGFALIQAFNSPELEIRGVSVVYGNAPFEAAWPIGQEIVAMFGPKGLKCYARSFTGRTARRRDRCVARHRLPRSRREADNTRPRTGD
ncbi:MAG: hypothetical protein IPL01_09070 [Acidobacteria bacterium]|nr:hypothetical protein [Acidobacteriota bacterium]